MRMQWVRKIRRVVCTGLLALGLAGAALLFVPLTAQSAHGATYKLVFVQSGPSTQQELIRETREAAGEDENAQFKQSPSVQLVSRLTGLSLEHAYWLCVALNFLVVAVVIVWLSKKNLPTMFRSRTVAIQKAMEDARKASEEANRRLAGIEERLSKLDVEIGEMRAAAEKEGAAEEQRIKAAAELDARRIVERAEQEIAAVARNARRELTAFAADLAVSLAQKQIQVDAATDQRLIQNFAQQLQNNGGERKDGH